MLAGEGGKVGHLVFVVTADDDGGTSDEFIDDASMKTLSELLDEPGQNFEGFLRFMGVVELSEIRARDYTKAVNALMSKRRLLKEREQGGPQ